LGNAAGLRLIKLITSISTDADVSYGRNLFGDLKAHGPAEVTTAGRNHIIQSSRPETGGPWLRFALARVSKDLEASALFPQAQQFSILSLAYYPRQRWGA
jgi:hypothetical protein